MFLKMWFELFASFHFVHWLDLSFIKIEFPNIPIYTFVFSFLVYLRS